MCEPKKVFDDDSVGESPPHGAQSSSSRRLASSGGAKARGSSEQSRLMLSRFNKFVKHSADRVKQKQQQLFQQGLNKASNKENAQADVSSTRSVHEINPSGTFASIQDLGDESEKHQDKISILPRFFAKQRDSRYSH